MQGACAKLPYAPDPALQCFSHYLINGKVLGKEKFIKHKTSVLIFFLQLLSLAFLILRRTERDMIKNVYCSSFKVSDILAR